MMQNWDSGYREINVKAEIYQHDIAQGCLKQIQTSLKFANRQINFNFNFSKMRTDLTQKYKTIIFFNIMALLNAKLIMINVYFCSKLCYSENIRKNNFSGTLRFNELIRYIYLLPDQQW